MATIDQQLIAFVIPYIISIVLGFIFVINIKQNINLLKLKLIPNSAILRFKTPSRKEEEVVVRLTDKVYKRKEKGKTYAYIIDSTKMYFRGLVNKFKPMQPKKDKDNKPTKNDPTIEDMLAEQMKGITFRGKIPILEFRTDTAEPIDVFSIKSSLSSEMLEGMLVAAEATADMDFFKKLFGYKNIWQIAGAIAICSVAAAFLSWQIYNFINNNPLLLGEVPICQIAADTAEIIIPS